MNIIRGELLFLFCPEFSVSSFTLHLQKSLNSFSGKRLAHNYTTVFSRYTFYLVFLLSSFLQVSSKLDAPTESDGSSGSRCFPSANLVKHTCGRNRSVSASTLSSQGGQAMGWGGPLVIPGDPAVVITSSVSVPIQLLASLPSQSTKEHCNPDSFPALTGHAQNTSQLLSLLLFTSETMNRKKSGANIPRPAEVGVWMLFSQVSLPRTGNPCTCFLVLFGLSVNTISLNGKT